MKTDHIIGALRDDMEAHTVVPTLMVGDLNAEPPDFPAIQEIL